MDEFFKEVAEVREMTTEYRRQYRTYDPSAIYNKLDDMKRFTGDPAQQCIYDNMIYTMRRKLDAIPDEENNRVENARRREEIAARIFRDDSDSDDMIPND
jgi:hypothetical protein